MVTLRPDGVPDVYVHINGKSCTQRDLERIIKILTIARNWLAQEAVDKEARK
jgi:hypothetical protein